MLLSLRQNRAQVVMMFTIVKAFKVLGAKVPPEGVIGLAEPPFWILWKAVPIESTSCKIYMFSILSLVNM